MFCSTPTTEPTTEEEDTNHQPPPAFHPNAPLCHAHRRRRLHNDDGDGYDDADNVDGDSGWQRTVSLPPLDTQLSV